MPKKKPAKLWVLFDAHGDMIGVYTSPMKARQRIVNEDARAAGGLSDDFSSYSITLYVPFTKRRA